MSAVSCTPDFVIYAPSDVAGMMEHLVKPIIQGILATFALTTAREYMDNVDPSPKKLVVALSKKKPLKKMERELDKDVKISFYWSVDGAEDFTWEPLMNLSIHAENLELACKRQCDGTIKCVMTPIQVHVTKSPKRKTK